MIDFSACAGHDSRLYRGWSCRGAGDYFVCGLCEASVRGKVIVFVIWGIFSAKSCLADQITMTCEGTTSVGKPESRSTLPWHESISLDLDKRVLEGSLFGTLHVTHESPSSLGLDSDVMEDETGGKFKTGGTFDRITGHLNLYNHPLGDYIASSSTSLVCEPKKAKF